MLPPFLIGGADLVPATLVPATPRRTAALRFGTRLVAGVLAGATLADERAIVTGVVLGLVGAVPGTLGGAAVRRRLAARLGRDGPAAPIEDAVTIGGALRLAAP